jgi:hypothetical protein
MREAGITRTPYIQGNAVIYRKDAKNAKCREESLTVMGMRTTPPCGEAKRALRSLISFAILASLRLRGELFGVISTREKC